MSKKTIPSNEPKGRVITAMQSTGRVGKSTALESLMAYFDFAEVPYTATDADAEHQTLSSRFDDVKTVALNEADDLLKLYKRACKTAPVELIDIPAQKTDFILDVLERFNVIDLAAEEGVRLTVLLFIADDPAAEASLKKVVLHCEDRVDYVAIKNPARFKSSHFDGSGLEKTLAGWGTPIVTMPAVTQSTLDELQRAKARANRWLPIAEAMQSEGFNKFAAHELQHFLNAMYGQWHAARARLLPAGVEAKRSPVLLGEKGEVAKTALDLEVNLGD